MKLIDISQPLQNGMPVWPGDTEFQFALTWTKAESGSVNVGSLTMSAHTGTHIDAPFHFDDDGQKVLDLDLDLYVGKARVIEVTGKKSIDREALETHDLEGISRLLIKTNSWKNQDEFPREITYVAPEGAAYLAEKGIRLIGLDVPSVDPIDSKVLPGHHSLLQHGIFILEGAVLNHISPGDYELIALPLALKDADGSPVRAVLRTLE